jgi:hypothetical protein
MRRNALRLLRPTILGLILCFCFLQRSCGLPPIAAVELPKVLLSANSSSRKLVSLRPAGVVAPPGEGRLLSVTFLGDARKVTLTAGALCRQAKPALTATAK